MERYFSQLESEKMKDAYPELFYQIGVTPNNTEVARCVQDQECIDRMNTFTENNKATTPTAQGDPKWRYMWKMGSSSGYSSSDTRRRVAEPPRQIIPENFKNEWEPKMNTWGNKLLQTVKKVTGIIQSELNTKLLDLLDGGNHLLAPTGTDISKFGTPGTVYASFHYDISFLTIHGKSKFPGLRIWLQNNTRLNVKIPDGCLLLQVGKQLELLTNGYFKAGYHEVVCTEKTLEAFDTHKTDWRVSSTLFAHANSDVYLTPTLKTGDFVTSELKHIGLTKK
jgi:isopenicillin N synthase-like dioxygenase